MFFQISSIFVFLLGFFGAKAENPYAYGSYMTNPMVGGGMTGGGMRESLYSGMGNAYTTNWPYGRQKYYPDGEVYIRKSYDRQYLSGMGNQMLMGNTGLYGNMNMMNNNMYGNGYVNRPRFGVPELMGGSGQPIVINGYPMYPKNAYASNGYPMIMTTSMPISSFYGSPTVYQGPTVSRLPFRTA